MFASILPFQLQFNELNKFWYRQSAPKYVPGRCWSGNNFLIPPSFENIHVQQFLASSPSFAQFTESRVPSCAALWECLQSFRSTCPQVASWGPKQVHQTPKNGQKHNAYVYIKFACLICVYDYWCNRNARSLQNPFWASTKWCCDIWFYQTSQTQHFKIFETSGPSCFTIAQNKNNMTCAKRSAFLLDNCIRNRLSSDMFRLCSKFVPHNTPQQPCSIFANLSNNSKYTTISNTTSPHHCAPHHQLSVSIGDIFVRSWATFFSKLSGSMFTLYMNRSSCWTYRMQNHGRKIPNILYQLICMNLLSDSPAKEGRATWKQLAYSAKDQHLTIT